MNQVTYMSNTLTTTKNWMPSGPMAIGPITAVLFVGRVSAVSEARARGGVLRWFPSR